MKIDDKVAAKLKSGIESLLRIGKTTGQIADMLSKQASFGKYDGCTHSAILELSVQICREHNKTIRAENKEVARLARESFERNFPDFAKYFKF